MKNIIDRILGLNDSEFNNRLINTVLCMGVLIGISSVFINLVSNVNIYTHISNAIVLITYSTLYYLARFKKKHRQIKWPLTISTIAFLDILWFTSGGLESPMIFYFFLSSTCFIIYANSKEVWLITLASVINLTVIIFLESSTEWVMPYADADIRFLDFGLSGIVSLILMVLLIRSLKVNYDIEKKRSEQRGEKVELLLKELNHRTKNNLQLISSLLGLQSQRLENSEAKKAIQIGKDRVRVMGNIHKYLYKEDDSTKIDFKQYIDQLTSELIHIHAGNNSVRVINEISPGKLDADIVLNLGLIVNEIFTNSLKYAFHETPNPEVLIQMKKTADQFEFTIRDNGSGVSDFEEMKAKDSLGLRIIELLTRQIRGDLEIQNNQGLEYRLTFNS